jgi:hypothetical protein
MIGCWFRAGADSRGLQRRQQLLDPGEARIKGVGQGVDARSEVVDSLQDGGRHDCACACVGLCCCSFEVLRQQPQRFHQR